MWIYIVIIIMLWCVVAAGLSLGSRRKKNGWKIDRYLVFGVRTPILVGALPIDVYASVVSPTLHHAIVYAFKILNIVSKHEYHIIAQ